MSADLASACQCFGLYDQDKIIGFCAYLHQPHPTNKKIKRCSRLVILPDYQGIGLGTKFLNFVADYVTKQGYDFELITSAKNMIQALKNNEHWVLSRYSQQQYSKTGKIDRKDLRLKSLRNNCKSATFFYRRNNSSC